MPPEQSFARPYVETHAILCGWVAKTVKDVIHNALPLELYSNLSRQTSIYILSSFRYSTVKINPWALQYSSLWQLNMVESFNLARLQRVDAASLLKILLRLFSSLSRYISVSLYNIGKTINWVFRIPSGLQGARKCHSVWKRLRMDIN